MTRLDSVVALGAFAVTSVLFGQGGEDASTATPIESLPFSETGTTAGFLDDADEDCMEPGVPGESDAPDVWYSFTPSRSMAIDVGLCESSYDTKMFIYDADLNVVACSDDACTDSSGNPFRSAVTRVQLDACATYYIVIDGWGGEFGDYAMEMDESEFVCDTLPPFLGDEGALACAGDAASGVVTAVYPELRMTAPFTIEAWVKPDSISGIARIASTRGFDPFSVGSGFGRNGDRLRFTTYGILDYDSPPVLTAAEWQHVAVAVDENQDAHFYRNGVLVGTVVGSTPAVDSESDFWIGVNPSCCGVEEPWNGQIDEMRYWDHVRTEAEIAADLTAVLEGTEAGLVGYWRFSEGSGTTTADIAGGHDGDLVGLVSLIELAECSEPCEGDVTRDGAVDVADLLIVLGQWDATCGDGDANGDGIVDVTDLLLVIGSWGPCAAPTGACCLVDDCMDVTADECIAMGGTYNIGADCADGVCESADGWLVTAPFEFAGNTCSADDDCLFSETPDERFVVTILEAGTWTFGVCNADWDTYMILGSTPCEADIDEDDDGCGSLASEITVDLEPGTYYLTVEGLFEGDCGPFILTAERQ